MKMKKIYLQITFLLLMLFPVKWGKAQANLQFNQVLMLTSTASSDNSLGTVPAGKVWKLESVGGGTTSDVSIRINGVNGGMFNNNYGGYSGIYYNSCHLPIWFPAGTQLGFGGNNGTSLFWFSIIEFNVVP
jgi:hypothetical protein